MFAAEMSPAQRKSDGGASVLPAHERQSGSPSASSVMRFTIGAFGDPMEKEAEAAAFHIASGKEGTAPPVSRSSAPSAVNALSEQTPQKGGGNTVRLLPAGRTIGGTAGKNALERALTGPKRGTPLIPAVRGKLEKGLGVGLRDVRVHTGTEAQEAAAGMKARAFTHGNDIYLGRGESPGDLALMAHEAAHVAQRQDVVRRAEEGGSWWSGLSGVWDATGGKLVDSAGKAIKMGSEMFWKAIEYLAPTIAPVLRQISSKGIFSYLYDKMGSVVSGIFKRFNLAGNPVQMLVDLFNKLSGKVRSILDYFATFDCGPIKKGIEALQTALSEVAGALWEKTKAFFSPIGDFISQIWNSVGAPVIQTIKEVAGDVWQGISDLAGSLWEKTAPFRNAVTGAWTWVKEQLGFGEGAGEGKGGLMQAIQEKLGQVWGKIKTEMQPVLAPMMAVVEKVKAVLPLEAIAKLKEKISGMVERTSDMADALDKDDGIAQNQSLLRDAILPAVLKTLGALRSGIATAGTWIAGAIGGVQSVVGNFMVSLRRFPLAASAAPALAWLEGGIDRLAQWATMGVNMVFGLFDKGLELYIGFVKPVFSLLEKIAAVLGDLVGKLPDLLLGPVWFLMPECIKRPIKDFFINQILKRIPIFSQILEVPAAWEKVKTTAIKIITLVFKDGNLLKAAWTYFKAILEIFGIPGALLIEIVKNAAKAYLEILSNPVGFLINLLKAVKEGFGLFFGNIVTNLMTGIAAWLFEAAAENGITPPRSLNSMGEIFNFILQLMGITVENILLKVEEKAGKSIADKLRKVKDAMETGWEWVTILYKEGFVGLWVVLKSKLSDLWSVVMETTVGYIIEKVTIKASEWLLTLIDPTGIMAVVNTCIAIYKAIESFFQYLKKMLEIVNSVFKGTIDIAKGAIGKAAQFLNDAVVNSLPVVIGFLANQLGLGRIAKKIKEIVEKVKERVWDAIGKLVDAGISAFKSGVNAGKSVIGKIFEWWNEKDTFEAGPGKLGTVYFEGEKNARLMIAMSPGESYDTFLARLKEKSASNNVPVDLIESARKKAKEVETKTADYDKKYAEYKSKGNEKVKAECEAIAVAIRECKKEFARTMKKIYEKIAVADETGPLPDKKLQKLKFSGMQNDLGTGMEVEVYPDVPFGSQDTEKPKIFADLGPAAKGAKDNIPPFYIMGHLLNANLGGEGVKKNLTPITTKANGDHLRWAERHVKTWVLTKKRPAYYSVKANYPGRTFTPGYDFATTDKDAKRKITSTVADKMKGAEEKLTTALDCYAVDLIYDGNKKEWVRNSSPQLFMKERIENK